MDKVKQAIADKFLMIIQNPHTSGSALVIGLLKIAGIIWPQRKSTFDEITAAAVIWLGINAGDASRSASKEQVAAAISSGDTSMLTKAQVTPTTKA